MRRIESEEMSDVIFEVLMPTERVARGKEREKIRIDQEIFPGYLLINMHLLNEEGGLVGRSWYFIQDTHGVIGFAGPKTILFP